MELFDTHAHFVPSAEQIAAQLVRAKAAGVGRVAAVGGSEELNAGARCALSVARQGGEVAVTVALGYDRDQAGKELPAIDYSGAGAVGEIGLDYFYEGVARNLQIGLFSRQLATAGELDLPVIVHTREADDDTLAVLRELPSRGIIHCFTGGTKFCGRLLDLGFFVSLSGIVTFRAAENVRTLARYIPLDRLLIETDSPYLAPVPMRGQANEPAFLRHTAEFLAGLLQIPLDELARRTTGNAELVFKK